MPRLLFEKTGNAIWISHLDLMRVFQRAFKRAALPLTHTQGFNPRPSVSIALPLSVGTESVCELLDFDLDGDIIDCDSIKDRLNPKLISGVKVLSVYNDKRKIRDLSLLNCQIRLYYDNCVPLEAIDQITELFTKDEVLVEKRTKSGLQQQNIIPMIRRITISADTENSILLDSLICSQNPTLNPAQIGLAVQLYLPELKPDHIEYKRLEIYDTNEVVFR